jgi:hypothetical protein
VVSAVYDIIDSSAETIAVYDIIDSSAETIGARNTGCHIVNLHRFTKDVMQHGVARVVGAGGEGVKEHAFVALDAVAASEVETEGALLGLVTAGQGLTLVHFSAQLERFVWDMECA